MTKDEIVTALRCCSDIRAKCNDCILCKRVECTYELKVDAADLIENQQREIEALRQANRRIRETHYHESAVQAMQVRQKWIPVTERLPENGERVLAYCKDRVIHDVKWSWPQNAWFDKATGHEYFESFVTHWMPMPEEPAQEG